MSGLLIAESQTHVLGTVGYVAIAGGALWMSDRQNQIHLVAVSATLLLIAGYILAVSLYPPENQDTYLVNRASAVVVVWFAYYFTLRYRKTQEREHTHRIELEEQKIAGERLKSSLELHEAIARNFPVGWIGILDENLAYVVAGGKGLGRAGISASDIIGKAFSVVSRSDKAESHLKRALEGRNVAFEIDFGSRTFEIHASPLHSSGRTTWILIVVHDITTVKETETRLIETLEKERELGELKSRFVTMASHEFRTPLTTIMSSASLLSKYSGEKYEKQKDAHIERIKRSVKQLTDTLHDFLSITRLEEGGLQPNYTPIDLRDFLTEVAEEAESLKHDNQQLIVRQSKDVTLVTDRHLLKAILQNLTSNAFKYSHAEGHVILQAEVQSGQVNLSVTDHGIGILAEDKEHVFDRFFRGKNAANIQGTGLGLCIAKKYASLLGGAITFTSKANESTTFTIRIPVRKPDGPTFSRFHTPLLF